MAFTLKWSQEALEDIESIATYIEKAETLQEFSELGRKVPEFNDITVREIFIYSSNSRQNTP